MKTYEVTMKSQQGHFYIYICEAEDEFEASEKTYEKISVKGWTNHQYMVDDVLEVTNDLN